MSAVLPGSPIAGSCIPMCVASKCKTAVAFGDNWGLLIIIFHFPISEAPLRL